MWRLLIRSTSSLSPAVSIFLAVCCLAIFGTSVVADPDSDPDDQYWHALGVPGAGSSVAASLTVRF